MRPSFMRLADRARISSRVHNISTRILRKPSGIFCCVYTLRRLVKSSIFMKRSVIPSYAAPTFFAVYYPRSVDLIYELTLKE